VTDKYAALAPQHTRQCVDHTGVLKKRFTQALAADYALKILDERAVRLNVYHCPECGFWHVGQKRDGR
jgi:rubrerythrin